MDMQRLSNCNKLLKLCHLGFNISASLKGFCKGHQNKRVYTMLFDENRTKTSTKEIKFNSRCF